MLNYHIPSELPFGFLKSIGIESVEKVEISAISNGEKLHCYNNVMRYLESNQGEIQLGWVFSQLGNIVFKLNAHAVVKLPNRSLLCVTPPEHDMKEINFVPDDSIASLIRNNKLPVRVYPLVEDKTVHDYVKLENLESEMRLDSNLLAIAYIWDQKHKMSGNLIEVYNKHL